MVLDEIYERFAKSSPATVMMRGILEHCLSDQRLNEIFEQTAQVQYTRELAFSTVVRLMSQVVTRIQPSVHAAYRQVAEDVQVSPRSLYGKLEQAVDGPLTESEFMKKSAELHLPPFSKELASLK